MIRVVIFCLAIETKEINKKRKKDRKKERKRKKDRKEERMGSNSCYYSDKK